MSLPEMQSMQHCPDLFHVVSVSLSSQVRLGFLKFFFCYGMKWDGVLSLESEGGIDRCI